MALASQHVSRVVGAIKENSGGGWDGYTQLSIYWLNHLDDLDHVKKGHFSLQVSDNILYLAPPRVQIFSEL